MNAITLPTNYLALCERVEKLDPEAAKYMREEAPKLPRFAYLPEDTEPVADLSSAFEWGRTPQGHEYWKSIKDRLTSGSEAPK